MSKKIVDRSLLVKNKNWGLKQGFCWLYGWNDPRNTQTKFVYNDSQM